MFDELLSVIAPHYCYGCGKTGQIICQKCKKYITQMTYTTCVLCDRRPKHGNYCGRHHFPVGQIYCLLLRRGAVLQAIDALKFERKRAVINDLAAIADKLLPQLPANSVLVPIPTTPRNTRIRGYDHMKLICRQLGRVRNIPVKQIIQRRNNVTQHFTKSAKQRRMQAKEFFRVAGNIDPSKHYYLVDDIFTTGATVREAAHCLRQAGATSVTIIVLTRHDSQKSTVD
jgi:phosphoribosyltransferase